MICYGNWEFLVGGDNFRLGLSVEVAFVQSPGWRKKPVKQDLGTEHLRNGTVYFSKHTTCVRGLQLQHLGRGVSNIWCLVLSFSLPCFTDSCHQLWLSHLPEECPLWLRGVLAASIPGKGPVGPIWARPGLSKSWSGCKATSFLCAAGGGQGTVWGLRLGRE